MRKCCLFGAYARFFIVVHCSKRAQPTSHLESLGLLIAPSVGDLSRVWRVICCVALQMWGDLSHVWRVGVDAVPYNRQSTRVLCVNAFVCVRLRRAEKKPLERESG